MAIPTKAQIEFAETIARTLDIDIPVWFSKEEYSDFIAEHVDAYDERVIEKRRDEYRRGEV
jgi:hypothetical protein